MKQNIDKYLKISCIIYMILIIIGIFLPDAYVMGIQDLTERPNAFLMIIKWFNYVSVLAFPIAVSYKRPTFKKICVYFCSVIGIIFLLLYSEVIKGYTSELGTGICDIRYLPPFVESFMKNVIFRSIFFFSTILIELVTVGLIIYEDLKNEKTIFRFKKSDVVNLVIILPLLIMSILPPYALEGIFFTYTNVIFKAFTIPHFIWLICIVAEIVICVIIFRKKTKEDAIILVTILALSLFVQFNLLFSTLGELTCKRLPLQLCNIASYLTIISIVFNKRKLFLFNALVNIPGALIAVFVMDVEGKGILYWSNIHYIVEHHNVIVVPLLCLLLGVFEPLKKEDFKAYAIYFSVYYLIILVLGTTFNALYKSTGSSYFYCNYLFMFDKDTAVRLIGSLGNLFDIKIMLGNITLYPVIQLAVYVIFFLIGSLTYVILSKSIKYRKN